MPADELPEPVADRLAADLAELSGFVEPGVPGWSRPVLTDPYRAARGWVRSRMVDAGLEVHVDVAGNVVGTLPGRDRSLPALVAGSHTDTVPSGGRFDGMVGVLGAIETARLLRAAGAQLERDLVVVDFLGEEANEFGVSCLGSRAITGLLRPQHYDLVDHTGVRLGDAVERFGLDPDAMLRAAWNPQDVHAYVELHIEQGPILEAAGTTIGVVTAIAGIERLLARFTGRPDHAGTTPMDSRSDALLAAAEAVLTVERVACGAPVHAVATSGRIETWPGATNVVPGSAQLWSEVRSVDAGWLHGARRDLADQIAAAASARGVDTLVEWLTDQDPVPTHPGVQDHIARAAETTGLSWQSVPSGAGHDAAHLARLAPMGMIFVPSKGGRSHVPEEETAIDDVVAGVRVLARTLQQLDRDPRPEH